MRLTAISILLAVALTGAVVTASSAPVATPHSRPGESFRDCADCPELVVLPGGTFTMGSPKDEPGFFEIEGPQHQVTIKQFAAGKYHVTRGQWAAFVAATKRVTADGCAWTPTPKGDPKGSWKILGFPQDDSHPVGCMNWNDTQDYVKWLSERTGRTYRLLTEAEWEYAARAGSTTAFPWGPKADHDYANYGADECCAPLTSGRDRWKHTSPVGSFPPNAFGLYDMNGNILQWVQDCLAPSYNDVPADGSAYETDTTLTLPAEFKEMNEISSCSQRMLRGGDWNNPPAMIRSAFRNFGPPPDFPNGRVGGFRVAATLN